MLSGRFIWALYAVIQACLLVVCAEEESLLQFDGWLLNKKKMWIVSYSSSKGQGSNQSFTQRYGQSEKEAAVDHPFSELAASSSQEKSKVAGLSGETISKPPQPFASSTRLGILSPNPISIPWQAFPSTPHLISSAGDTPLASTPYKTSPATSPSSFPSGDQSLPAWSARPAIGRPNQAPGVPKTGMPSNRPVTVSPVGRTTADSPKTAKPSVQEPAEKWKKYFKEKKTGAL